MIKCNYLEQIPFLRQGLREMKRYIASTILALLGASSSSVLAGPSLCTKGETVFFSCPVRGGKIISLCGNIGDANRATNDEWLQYRFGRPGAIELSYPATKKDSLSRFTGEHVLTHTAVREIDVQSVSFVSGGIGYYVESSVLESGKVVQGVSIGDPRKFDLPVPAKPRAASPDAVISCTSQADKRNFYDLVHYLRD